MANSSNDESEAVLRKQECPHCGSETGATYYDDNHAHCFSCERTWDYDPDTLAVSGSSRPGGTKREPVSTEVQEIIDKASPRKLDSRAITQATARFWNYLVYKKSNGDYIQAAIMPDANGRPQAAKLRNVGPDGSKKEFTQIGNLKAASRLWGRHLWPDGNDKIKMLVITEGEIDAMSVSQSFGNKFPVVSLIGGATSARKDITSELQWVNSFERVVLMFDMDEPGRNAAEDAARALPPGKAHIARLPEGYKDANELLKKGMSQEITNAAWNAKVFRPDGIVELSSLIGDVLAPPVNGLSWPWEFMTEWTYGRRYGEVYTFGGGSGSGKSDIVSQVVAHTIMPTQDGGNGEAVAVFSWEAGPTGTSKAVLGKIKQRRFHIPDPDDVLWTDDELRDAVDYYEKHCAKLYINDHFGAVEWDEVKERIRYLAHAEGVRHFVLDPITALAAAEDDERKFIERFMAEVAGLAQELSVCMYLVSHLATPDHGAHEEGARVELRHFKGSRAIAFWTFFAFGIERNQQSDEEVERATSTLRVLKDRYTGNSLGKTKTLVYNSLTGQQEVAASAEVFETDSAIGDVTDEDKEIARALGQQD